MKINYTDRELVHLAQQNDVEAIDILIARYSSIIGTIASSYYGVGLDYEDFYQEGRVAFIKAIENFDENLDTEFNTYAMKCVRNSITTVFRKVKKTTEKDRLIERMESYAAEPILQDYTYAERLHITLNEKMIIEEALADSSLLSDLEKQCLKYHLLDNNYKEIAVILGVSPKKVLNALGRCKAKLKKLN